MIAKFGPLADGGQPAATIAAVHNFLDRKNHRPNPINRPEVIPTQEGNSMKQLDLFSHARSTRRPRRLMPKAFSKSQLQPLRAEMKKRP